MSIVRSMETKNCLRCGEDKPLDDFNKSAKGTFGRQRYCRKCQHDHYMNNRARHTANAKARRQRFRGERYGLTPEEYDKLRAIEVCELCGLRKAIRIDHDHTTGKVRGHLCNECNVGLGLLGDAIEGLMKAVHYLERS